MKNLLLRTIKFYQKYLHTLIPSGSCRFIPTCSTYAYEAINKYGTMTGLFLAAKRVARCHPWSKGGPDPLL